MTKENGLPVGKIQMFHAGSVHLFFTHCGQQLVGAIAEQGNDPNPKIVHTHTQVYVCHMYCIYRICL